METRLITAGTVVACGDAQHINQVTTWRERPQAALDDRPSATIDATVPVRVGGAARARQFPRMLQFPSPAPMRAAAPPVVVRAFGAPES